MEGGGRVGGRCRPALGMVTVRGLAGPPRKSRYIRSHVRIH